MSEFDYDDLKSLANRLKHGVELAAAEKLWLDPGRKFVRARATVTETRYGPLATHQGKIWRVTFATRDGRYRIISIRRARKKEVAHYQRRGI